MKLFARIKNIRFGQTQMGSGPFGGTRGLAYIADVNIFHDEVKIVNDGHDGTSLAQRLYVGMYVSDKEPIPKNLEELGERCMETYRRELVEAAQTAKNMMIQKDKENEINKKFANFIVEE